MACMSHWTPSPLWLLIFVVYAQMGSEAQHVELLCSKARTVNMRGDTRSNSWSRSRIWTWRREVRSMLSRACRMTLELMELGSQLGRSKKVNDHGPDHRCACAKWRMESWNWWLRWGLKCEQLSTACLLLTQLGTCPVSLVILAQADSTVVMEWVTVPSLKEKGGK